MPQIIPTATPVMPEPRSASPRAALHNYPPARPPEPSDGSLGARVAALAAELPRDEDESLDRVRERHRLAVLAWNLSRLGSEARRRALVELREAAHGASPGLGDRIERLVRSAAQRWPDDPRQVDELRVEQAGPDRFLVIATPR